MATTVSSIILSTTATTSIPTSLFNPNPTGVINNFPPIGSDGGNVNGGSRNISYFFGFLIALIAFLVFFIGCGIGARRGLWRRQRRRDEEIGNGFLSSMAFGQSASHMSPLRKPVLWETPFDTGSSQWESMLPLSVSVVPDKVDDATAIPPYTPLLMPMTNWLQSREAMPRDTTLHWWMRKLPRIMRETVPMNISQTTAGRSPPLSSSIPTVKRTSADALTPPHMQPDFQVVVLIAMPSQRATTDGSLGDLHIGVTKLPVMWDSGVEFVS